MNNLASIPSWLQQNGVALFQQAPGWLIEYRQQHWDAFLKNGFPTRKDERWKYTDLSFLTNRQFATPSKGDEYQLMDVIHQHRLQRGESILLVFVNGYFMPVLSDLAKLPENVVVSNMAQAFQTHADLIKTNWLDSVDAKKY